MKRAYLANLENQYEMNYVMYIMQSSGLKDIYIGANNIIKRSKFIYIQIFFKWYQTKTHENMRITYLFEFSCMFKTYTLLLNK